MSNSNLPSNHLTQKAHSEDDKDDGAYNDTNNLCHEYPCHWRGYGRLVFEFVCIAKGFAREIPAYKLLVKAPRALPGAATVPHPCNIEVLYAHA